MFSLDVAWWEIVLRAGLVYVALLFGLRLGGKRELGQMAPFDLVVVLLIADAVQNAMVGPDTSVSVASSPPRYCSSPTPGWRAIGRRSRGCANWSRATRLCS